MMLIRIESALAKLREGMIEERRATLPYDINVAIKALIQDNKALALFSESIANNPNLIEISRLKCPAMRLQRALIYQASPQFNKMELISRYEQHLVKLKKQSNLQDGEKTLFSFFKPESSKLSTKISAVQNIIEALKGNPYQFTDEEIASLGKGNEEAIYKYNESHQRLVLDVIGFNQYSSNGSSK